MMALVPLHLLAAADAAQTAAAEQAMAGVGKAYSDAIQASGRDLASMGISPESGRALAIREAGATDASRAAVSAANQARFGAREEGRALTSRAAAALSGAPVAATAASGQGAQIAAGGVGTAQTPPQCTARRGVEQQAVAREAVRVVAQRRPRRSRNTA